MPADVLLVREQPPGGGPVAALRAGLAEVSTDVVALLAGDLPFLTAALVAELRARLTGDGVLVVDDGGRDQYLLGVWRTAALRAAVAGAGGPTSLRRVLAPLAVGRLPPGRRAGRSRRRGWTATPPPTSPGPARRPADPDRPDRRHRRRPPAASGAGCPPSRRSGRASGAPGRR